MRVRLGSCDLLKNFLVNKCWYHRNGTRYRWKTNRKSHVSYRIAPTSITLSDLESDLSFFWNPSNSHLSWNIHVLTTICAYMNRKASVAFNSNCQSIMGYFLTLQRNYVHCEKVTVSQKWNKIDTLLLPATNRREVSIHAISDDLEWPWMRLACCRAYKLQFDRHMCDVRSPSATAELLVRLANKRTNRQTDRHTDGQQWC